MNPYIYSEYMIPGFRSAEQTRGSTALCGYHRINRTYIRVYQVRTYVYIFTHK